MRNLDKEVEEIDCEIMTIIYDWCGVQKEFTGPKEQVIAIVREIQDKPQIMRFIRINHPQGTVT